QIIMENLGGGGHFTNAAVQLSNVTVAEVKEQLLDVIRQNINVIKNNSTLQKLALDLPKPAERVNGIYSPTGEEINFS
ncbi:hypothetical protein QP509_09295, partial [Lactobacillus mulieris]|uniref:hypothetical protein n=1 Tax=Lactobacillus mulieris TaxID=2508708 RepID=UPI00254AC9C9